MNIYVCFRRHYPEKCGPVRAAAGKEAPAPGNAEKRKKCRIIHFLQFLVLKYQKQEKENIQNNQN